MERRLPAELFPYRIRNIAARNNAQTDLKCCAFTRQCVDRYISVVLFDDAVHNRQPQTGSLAHLLGRNKWLKNMLGRWSPDLSVPVHVDYYH